MKKKLFAFLLPAMLFAFSGCSSEFIEEDLSIDSEKDLVLEEVSLDEEEEPEEVDVVNSNLDDGFQTYVEGYDWYRDEFVRFQYPSGMTAFTSTMNEMWEGYGVEYDEDDPDSLESFRVNSTDYFFSFGMGGSYGVPLIYSYHEDDGFRDYSYSYEQDFHFKSLGRDEFDLFPVGPSELNWYILAPNEDYLGGYVFPEPYSTELLLLQKHDDLYLGAYPFSFSLTCHLNDEIDLKNCVDNTSVILSTAQWEGDRVGYVFKDAFFDFSFYENFFDGEIPWEIESKSVDLMDAIQIKDINLFSQIVQDVNLTPFPNYGLDGTPFLSDELSDFDMAESIFFGTCSDEDWNKTEIHMSMDDYFENHLGSSINWEDAYISFSDSRMNDLYSTDGKFDGNYIEYFLPASKSFDGRYWSLRIYFLENEHGSWDVSLLVPYVVDPDEPDSCDQYKAEGGSLNYST